MSCSVAAIADGDSSVGKNHVNRSNSESRQEIRIGIDSWIDSESGLVYFPNAVVNNNNDLTSIRKRSLREYFVRYTIEEYVDSILNPERR